MIAITGATGKVGNALAIALLAEGKKVRVIARESEKLKELAAKGAEPMAGDLHDAAFVRKALAGCKAVFLIHPPNFHSSDYRAEQRQFSRNYADAVKANRIQYVVLLSSIGAHMRKGAGVVDGLADMEEAFTDAEGVNVLVLRPTYFMENVMGQIGTIRQMGIMGSPINGTVKFPLVSAKDVAAVAAKRLSKLDFSGTEIAYILGPRDLSYDEIASAIGSAIGMPGLKYVRFSYEDARNAMVASGFTSENVAESYNGLAEAINNGKALEDHKRTPENTTPTTIEEFAQVFAGVYKQ